MDSAFLTRHRQSLLATGFDSDGLSLRQERGNLAVIQRNEQQARQKYRFVPAWRPVRGHALAEDGGEILIWDYSYWH